MAYRFEQKVGNNIYVYEVISFWDKEKKQPRQKREILGKKDPITGELIPSKKKKLSTIISNSKHYGNYYLLDQIVDNIGLKKILKNIFPKEYKRILTCAFHQVCTGDSLSNAEQWTGITHTYDDKIFTTQRISELLTKITFNDRTIFFKKWAEYRVENEYIAFDITSISSYSKLIEIVEYGYNRDKEQLPQINLGMLFGESSKLPIFYNSYPGSIKDVSTLDNLLNTANQLGIEKIRIVMDKGFYKKDNIGNLLKRYFKFTIGVPFTTNLAIDAIEEVKDVIGSPTNSILINNDVLGACTIKTKWQDTNRNIYVHVFYNEKKFLYDKEKLIKKILFLEEEIKNNKMKLSNEELYDKYFVIKKVNQSTTNIIRKEEVIDEELKYKGYFVAISNDITDAKTAMETYRLKDVVEKSFNNIKDELDLERLRVHSEQAIQGKLYITFIASIILSMIHNKMKETGLDKKYTKKGLLSEMSKINIVKYSDDNKLLTEVSKNQTEILNAFNIKTPII